MTTFINDLKNALVHDVSIAPGTQQAGDGTKNGLWVDMGDSIGPVHGIFAVGNSDEYSTFSVTVHLEEADDDSGTGAQDIDGTSVKTSTLASASATDNENQSVVVSANNRSKRYVRAVAVVDGTEVSSGASAIVELSAVVAGMKREI
jgi:hypothetical protein